MTRRRQGTLLPRRGSKLLLSPRGRFRRPAARVEIVNGTAGPLLCARWQRRRTRRKGVCERERAPAARECNNNNNNIRRTKPYLTLQRPRRFPLFLSLYTFYTFYIRIFVKTCVARARSRVKRVKTRQSRLTRRILEESRPRRNCGGRVGREI